MGKQWMGPAPEVCDLCRKRITKEFIDGKTASGPWGNLCPACHRQFGCGLGTGKGQMYQFFPASGVWSKVAG